ncbi:hypothetical protein CCR75_000172 [Bremia lactucae]|uniref:Uncharacterized protein n=1 Tax=Bremia lactucae TaxID=4779 RepID=A0A976FPJ4_BRELC|nr:hypothetical protein CCR75_000172 [Bremia lactucae]
MYDRSDETSPILLAVGGKTLDVTLGAKFYGKGKSYRMFAATACTRTWVRGSLISFTSNLIMEIDIYRR